MLTHVADARAAGDATVVAGAQDDVKGVATAEVAVRYVRHLIDRHRGPVIVDLTALTTWCAIAGCLM
jgi:hypothetical protein